jgi:hypothetical protein
MEGTMAAKCPYCEAQLEIVPKRKKRCPICQQEIYVRKRNLLSDKDAKIFDWMKRLEYYEVDNNVYIQEQKKLNNKFGDNPSVNDVIWSILNGLVAQGHVECYSDMVQIAREEGKDIKPYIKAQYEIEQKEGSN